MRTTRGTGRGRSRALLALACTVIALTATACSQPEPDERQVTEAVAALPGVAAVDASFTGTSLGGSGDQEIEVELTTPADPQQVEDLVRTLPGTLMGIDNADGYDEFVLTAGTATFAFGPTPVPTGLASRWSKASASSPPGPLSVQVRPAPRATTAALSSRGPVSAALTWALDSGLTDLEWSLVQYQTTQSPYVRFSLDRPLASSMVADYTTIEATYAARNSDASIARAVVVEDVNKVRKVRVSVTYPEVSGPVPEADRGPEVWPIVEAINASLPPNHRLDLELNRIERGTQVGGPPDGDLVDDGQGPADWEAAYRQRFPDPVPLSGPPT